MHTRADLRTERWKMAALEGTTEDDQKYNPGDEKDERASCVQDRLLFALYHQLLSQQGKVTAYEPLRALRYSGIDSFGHKEHQTDLQRTRRAAWLPERDILFSF